MSGYLDKSNYHPYGGPSHPARPLKGVQWVGVALLAFSVLLNLAFLAGQAGWIPKWNVTPALAPAPMIFGVLLMNSRREPIVDPAPELASARRRWLIIVAVGCAVILGAATLIDLVRG